MNLPPFLKRCYRFPRSVVEDREDDWCTPSRRRHRKCWGRAFELSLSVERLLETRDAWDFFRFLWTDYTAAEEDEDTDVEEEDDDDENENMEWVEREDYGLEDRMKIVWLSDNVFTFAIPNGDYLEFFHRNFDQGSCKVYSIQFDNIHRPHCDRVCIIMQPTARTVEHRLVDEISAMDVLLRLVAKLKRVNVDRDILDLVEIKAHSQYGRDLGATTEFPASLDALKSFVSEVQTDRSICLHKAGLSLEQWHAVTANCNKNVKLQLNYWVADGHDPIDCGIDNEIDRERSAFMEAAIQDHCPARIKLSHLDKASANNRQLLLNALESTTFLEELDVFMDANAMENFLSSIDIISRNRGYQRLKFRCWLYFLSRASSTPAVMECFCEAIASHPTLQDVKVEFLAHNPPTQPIERDQMLIRMIRQNTALRKFVIDRNFLHDSSSFYKAIDPVLEFNHFRQVVQSIKKETDSVHRKHLFTATLLSKPVRKSPDNRFLLFKENFDMLKQVTATRSESDMFRDRQRATMRGRVIETPSNLEEDEITGLERKRKLSCLPE